MQAFSYQHFSLSAIHSSRNPKTHFYFRVIGNFCYNYALDNCFEELQRSSFLMYG